MEQLIIFLLLALGSAVSSYLQKKKKREEAGRAAEAPRGEPPVPHWPATARDWQEELRRLVQGENRPAAAPAPARQAATPPVITKPAAARPAVPAAPRVERTSMVKSPLTQSTAAYGRAADLSRRVAEKLQAVDQRTKTHAAESLLVSRPAHQAGALMRRWTSNPEAVREAFIASLIFDAPPSIREPQPQ